MGELIMAIYHVILKARSSVNVTAEEYRAGNDFSDVLALLAIQYGYQNVFEFEDEWDVSAKEI
jgi:hypothetical protein